MSKRPDPDASKPRKPWVKPELKTIDLTDEERAELQASDEPMARLFKMRPKLLRKRGD